jgi:hypothetical protein
MLVLSLNRGCVYVKEAARTIFSSIIFTYLYVSVIILDSVSLLSR